MRPAAVVLAAAFLFAAPQLHAQCVSLTAAGTAYTQDFNTLAASGTANTALPAGWSLNESGTSARNDSGYGASNGSDNGGDVYSFGAASATDRAFGTLRSGTLIPIVGACFTNNTGATVTALSISYRGEQWRLGATGRNDRLDFQYSLDATSLATGAWTDANQLDFTAPLADGTAGALDGNANGAAVTAPISSLNVANGATFWIRWTDFDAAGADDGLGVDDFSLTPSTTPIVTVSELSVSDVSLAEGDTGATPFAVTVTLSPAAGAGGVTFDIATVDGTAQAPGDYTARALTRQTIAEGATSYTFTVQVNGDATLEPNETFLVQVTNVTGATIRKGTGTVTILNDDVVPISQIQGAGEVSPYTGMTVGALGIVTAQKTNGFFVQTPDTDADRDPRTSEAIFVFTSSAPPQAAAVGNLVRVVGTVAEFNTLTEITGPTVTLVSTGNPLPTPVTLTRPPFEWFEGMRVNVASLTVVAPTGGNVSEANATSTSNGILFGVIAGTPRPFREPGLEPAAGAVADCCVPVWDGNPERLRVTGGPAAATTGATIANLTGVLDFASGSYSIIPDTGPTATGNRTATPITAPTTGQFTVASFNMQRFFDTANDPSSSDVVLTPAAYENRLRKAALLITDVLRLPDIIAVQEVENLAALQDIATRLNASYTAHLVEGNDPGGIDVGFLVKSSRVTVVNVTQEGKTATYRTPAGASDLLNDRPPLLLRATIGTFPITVIVNHLRSLTDIDDPTDGPRVRAKRRAQAEYLANLIQQRQLADPAERIVVVGDFNAFAFTDGYVHVFDIIRGQPSPHLVDTSDTTPVADRYSYVFDGSAQTLDQALFTQNLQPYFVRLEHARVNADFPEIYRNDPARPERLSDHDPAVAYFSLTPTDRGLAMSTRTSAVAGQPITYTIAEWNNTGATTFYTLTTLVPRDTPNGGTYPANGAIPPRTTSITSIVASPIEGRPLDERCCRTSQAPIWRRP